MEFRKTVKLELEDQLSFSWFAFKKLLVLMLVLVFVVVPLSTLSDILSGDSTWFDMLWSAGFSILMLGIFLLICIPLVRRSLKKQLSTNKLLQAPNEILINEEGVSTISEFSNAKLPWQNIQKAAEGAKAYYIYIAKAQAIVIPKRLLAPDEETALRALLQSHLTPKMCRLRQA